MIVQDGREDWSDHKKDMLKCCISCSYRKGVGPSVLSSGRINSRSALENTIADH